MKWPRKRQTTQVFFIIIYIILLCDIKSKDRKFGVRVGRGNILVSATVTRKTPPREERKCVFLTIRLQFSFKPYSCLSNIYYFLYINYTLYNWAPWNIRVQFRYFSATSKLLCIIKTISAVYIHRLNTNELKDSY